MLHKIPENVPMEFAALVEPLAVAHHAVARDVGEDQKSSFLHPGGSLGPGASGKQDFNLRVGGNERIQTRIATDDFA